MEKSWIKWNLWYIRSVNCDDEEGLYDFFDAGCDQKGFFTRKRYIWNIIRGKLFCQYFASWAIQWYKRIIEGCIDIDAYCQTVEATLVEAIHRVMASEQQENIKRSLVWKITKQAPILTIDTIPYISKDRLYHLLDSDKYIIADAAMKPIVDYCRQKSVETDTARALANAATQALIDP